MTTKSKRIARGVAAVAVLIFAWTALALSTVDIHATFDADATDGLTDDVVMTCTGPTTLGSSGTPAAADQQSAEAYNAWEEEQIREYGPEYDAPPVDTAACEEARHSRLIKLSWSLTGALACGVILLALYVAPGRNAPRTDRLPWEANDRDNAEPGR